MNDFQGNAINKTGGGGAWCPKTFRPGDYLPRKKCAPGDNMRSVSQSVPTILRPFVPLNRVDFKIHFWYLAMLG